jgi:hypothetical protein
MAIPDHATARPASEWRIPVGLVLVIPRRDRLGSRVELAAKLGGISLGFVNVTLGEAKIELVEEVAFGAGHHDSFRQM